MSDVIQHLGYRIRIELDQDPESPRDWDNLGTMTCFHKRYKLGDKRVVGEDEFSSWSDLREHLEDEGAVVILPMWMMDHSGLAISCSSQKFYAADSQRWDWGQIGYIWVDRATLLKEYSVKRLTKKILAKAEKVLIGEVETYHQYVAGEVYGYIIENEAGEHEDSCWGFFGREYAVEQAKEAVQYMSTLSPA